jgi:hypothetical protein
MVLLVILDLAVVNVIVDLTHGQPFAGAFAVVLRGCGMVISVSIFVILARMWAKIRDAKASP